MLWGKGGGQTLIVLFDANKLQAKRKNLNLTQAVLAEKADTSERYVRSLEASEKLNPSAILVFRLSRVLQLTMDDLMTVKTEDS